MIMLFAIGIHFRNPFAFGRAVLYFLNLFVFALCERKNEKSIIREYHAAVYAEPDEGQAISDLKCPRRK
jgi:hypothetical protein